MPIAHKQLKTKLKINKHKKMPMAYKQLKTKLKINKHKKNADGL